MIDGCHYKGQSQSTSLTRIYPEEASRRPLLFKEAKRGSTVDCRLLQGSTIEVEEDRLQESDRGSTTEDRLQEYRGRIDYRKVPRKSTRSTEEVNSKKSTEEVDYRSRTGVEVEARKNRLQEHNEKTTDTEYRGEPTFRLLDRRVLNTIARGVSGATTRRPTARTGSQEDQKAT